MNTRVPVVDAPKREAMRIAGEKVHADRVIEIRYPYTGEVVATVPKASVDGPSESPTNTSRSSPATSATGS
jgi:acyl-CoA reductase-like NAD-dependent aldehyde dehydrogenase